MKKLIILVMIVVGAIAFGSNETIQINSSTNQAGDREYQYIDDYSETSDKVGDLLVAKVNPVVDCVVEEEPEIVEYEYIDDYSETSDKVGNLLVTKVNPVIDCVVEEEHPDFEEYEYTYDDIKDKN